MKTSLVLLSSVTLLMVATLFSGCSKDDPSPVKEMLVNGNMEAGSTAPNAWFNSNPTSSIAYTWTTDASASSSHSIKISQSAASSDFAALGQNYAGTIPVGKDVTLSVKIKGVNLVGGGAAIAVRTDGASTPDLQFSSTEGAKSIAGTFDWTTYNVKLTNVSADAKYVIVYLIYLPNTTGTLYYDDASLTHN
jgi:hypothetical protein